MQTKKLEKLEKMVLANLESKNLLKKSVPENKVKSKNSNQIKNESINKKQDKDLTKKDNERSNFFSRLMDNLTNRR